MKKPSEPKDLGIKIGSKEEAAWTKARDTIEEEIQASRITLVMNETLLILANEKIEEEKEKFK